MSNFNYILDRINSGPIFKHWERDYSVFFCSSWGKVHAEQANSKEFGEGTMTLCLHPYSKGTSQYYRLFNDNENYLKVLANKYKNQPGFKDEVIATYSKYAEAMLAIFEEVKAKDSFDSVFVKRWAQAASDLIGYQILIIHRTDTYDAIFKDTPKIIEDIYNARKKYESAFGLLETHFEIMCKKLIESGKNITISELKLLTPAEFAEYLDTNKLPSNLKERDEQMLISHIPTTEIYVGDEAKKIVAAIRANEYQAEKDALAKLTIVGRTVFGKGIIEGTCQVITNYDEIKNFKAGEILVTPSTLPKYNDIYQKAKAIITNEGGALAHAAILCREFQIPGIVGTKVATDKLKTGDYVSLDLDAATIKIIQK